ncbi:MAG: segregation ATPase, FtsK/SpoIIIE family [Verrucomicrobiales bacterium]|nr:segregation ATPase, FtsK/SpoIIIE family [Verrucomicrobiales bacterium]
MSNHLGVKKTLEIIESFKNTVRDFSAREETLKQGLAAKVSLEQQRRDKGNETLNGELSEAISGAEVKHKDLQVAAQKKYQSRKAWIKKANRTSKRTGTERIEDAEGRKKYRLQVETMRLERKQKAELEATETAFQQFSDRWVQVDAELFVLEANVKKAVGGFGKFRRLLLKPIAADEPNPKSDEHQLASEVPVLMKQGESEWKQFRKSPLPFVFRFRIILAVLVLCQIPLVPLLLHFGKSGFSYREAGISVGACFVIGFVLHFFAKRSAEPLATKLARSITKARAMHNASWQRAEARRVSETERIQNEFQTATNHVNEEWKQILQDAAAAKDCVPLKVEEKEFRAAAKCDKLLHARLERLEQAHSATTDRLTKEANVKKEELRKVCEERESKLKGAHQEEWRALVGEWQAKVRELYTTVEAVNKNAAHTFPSWDLPLWKNWTPPEKFAHAAKFADIEVDLPKLAGVMPKDSELALSGPEKFSLPLLLSYPTEGSILLETTDSGSEQAVETLNNLVLRLLSVAPPGRVNFTVIDPIGLGQNFAGVMHLADYAEHLISNRIWTQTNQIEQKLGDLNDHMEKVIQMYLRNEFATIAEYNEQAGNIAEKYHFLVVAGFPANFTDTAARRLLSIATSGARCGVYTLIQWDRTQSVPPDFNVEELKKSSVCLTSKAGQITLTGKVIPGATVVLETPPPAEPASELIHKMGKSNRDSNRIEVPFSQITPPDAEVWSVETTSELRVPIGRTGATKFQYLSIGKGTRQHALLAGKTGSGKSTLFHVIITNLALWCSPEQVEFYLVDFKKGVEFKCYATHRLPHARVVAIESDREFGLSVLQKIDDELKRRGDLFRQAGVQDVAGYKRAGGTEPMPRTLLMIDEFQEFFVEEDRISQGASVLLDRIVRQGRAFGIHVFLGSQTLGGAYTMARTTMGQMVIRIALQCNEADAYLIMDESNPAPRLLTRPGEGIYNDAAGAREGNSPFQTVWLPDDVRDTYLEKVRLTAEQRPTRLPEPIIFEGDAPADIRDNVLLKNLLGAKKVQPTASPRIWLGAPNSIKGPTEAVFEQQSGNNLLVVGQRDEAVLSMLANALIALSAQFPKDGVRFVVFDSSPAGTPERDLLERVVREIPHPVNLAKNGDAEAVMKELSAEVNRRSEAQEAESAPIFIFVHDLQKFSKLRYEDDFSFSSDDSAEPNPAVQFTKLISAGAALGVHVIVTCDSYNNVNRFLSKKAFSEFEMRVLFQMSANDSASLIDNPKAGTLGLHRALFYNEQEGYLELFRPYALPVEEWVRDAGANLSRLLR